MTSQKFKQTEIGKIPEDWEELPANKFCIKVTDGTHDSPKKQIKGKYLITSKHIKAGRLDFDNAYFISEDDFIEVNKRSRVNQWDLIFGMIGTIGEIYLEQNKNPDYAIKNVGLFKCGSEIKGKWLFYFLKSLKAKDYIFRHSAGTTQQYMTLDSLRNFPIDFPKDKKEFEMIAKILSSIDAKIGLNNKMNKTLEAIGQAIFEKWFIDETKEDWKEGRLGDYVESISGCSYTSEGLESSENALVTLKSIGINGFKQEGFKEYTGGYNEKHLVQDGDIVVAHTDLTQDRIILGKPVIVRDFGKYKKMIASMDLSIVRPIKLINKPYLFYLLNTDVFHGYAQGYSNGTTVIHLSRKAIPEFTFLIPDKELLEKFKILSDNLFNKIRINDLQNQTLSQIRDALLPKLMSGEIRVK